MADILADRPSKQISWKAAVLAADGEDRNKPIYVYVFSNGVTERKFFEYPNINPYTGSSS